MLRIDFKIAILMSGKRQYEIAHGLGWTEGKLSKFVRGIYELRPEEEQQLRCVLGMDTEVIGVTSSE